MEDHEIRIPQPGEHYEHYKGGRYEVLAVGRLSEQRDQVMVVYRSLERGHIWIRPLGMWGEYVEWTTGAPAQGTLVFEPVKLATHRAQRFKLCEDSPPGAEVLPLSAEESAELDRELFELVATETAAPLESLRCQHRRNGSFPKQATLRLATVPDHESATGYRYRVAAELCVFCSGVALGQLRAEPMLCAPNKESPEGSGV